MKSQNHKNNNKKEMPPKISHQYNLKIQLLFPSDQFLKLNTQNNYSTYISHMKIHIIIQLLISYH